MANPDHLAALNKGVDAWNRWREAANSAPVDLSGADLSGMKLNEVSFLRANLTGANLTKTQLEHAQHASSRSIRCARPKSPLPSPTS